MLAGFTVCRKAPSALSVCHLSKNCLTPERSLDHHSRHSISPKSVRLDGSPTESVGKSFAITSANVKYPALHNRGTSREMNQVLQYFISSGIWTNSFERIFWSSDIAELKDFAFQLCFLKPRHSSFFRWNSMTLMVKLKDVNVPKGSLKFVFARLFPNQITTLLQWDSPNQRGEHSSPLIFIIRDYQIVSSHITL